MLFASGCAKNDTSCMRGKVMNAYSSYAVYIQYSINITLPFLSILLLALYEYVQSAGINVCTLQHL